MMRFTGHDLSSPIHQSNINVGNAIACPCNPVTTTQANCMILRIGGFAFGDIRVDITGLEGHTGVTMDRTGTRGGSCSGGAGYEQQAIAGTSSTPTFDLTYGNRFVTLTLAIAPPAASTGVVSGGAAYVKQAAPGSSGTSSFALTAAEQAQMLTLAIAPGAQTEVSADLTLIQGRAYEFDTTQAWEQALVPIDSTHYLCAYNGPGADGWAVVLTVNTSNWTITKETPFEFDPVVANKPALAQIDSIHFLCVYTGNGDDGWATVLTVNPSTWILSQGTPFEFDTVQGMEPALIQIDPDHYLCTYVGDLFHGWSVVLMPSVTQVLP